MKVAWNRRPLDEGHSRTPKEADGVLVYPSDSLT